MSQFKSNKFNKFGKSKFKPKSKPLPLKSPMSKSESLVPTILDAKWENYCRLKSLVEILVELRCASDVKNGDISDVIRRDGSARHCCAIFTEEKPCYFKCDYNWPKSPELRESRQRKELRQEGQTIKEIQEIQQIQEIKGACGMPLWPEFECEYVQYIHTC